MTEGLRPVSWFKRLLPWHETGPHASYPGRLPVPPAASMMARVSSFEETNYYFRKAARVMDLGAPMSRGCCSSPTAS